MSKELPVSRDDDLCFVIDWHENRTVICGIGPSYNDPDATVRLVVNIELDQFTPNSDVPLLRVIAALYSYERVIVYDNIQ